MGFWVLPDVATNVVSLATYNGLRIFVMRAKETLGQRQISFPRFWPAPSLVVASIIGVLVAVVLWITALDDIHMAHMNDLGLISVLPLSFLIALGTITLAFFLALHNEPFPTTLVCLIVIVLIVML